MFLVSKSEILHRRERLVERIENLCDGRYLPVEVLAVDIYDEGLFHLGLPREIDLHMNSIVIEQEYCAVEPEILCCVHKLCETWDRKCELVEEVNEKILKARSGDPMNKCFQVCANTTEPEKAKVGECYDRRRHELSLYLTVGDREEKGDHKRLQLGHE
jgi:hypothetical protein